ncbi:chorismate--pyruvate lyase family protein [Candidatus Hecatella orcuttiae]|jgi:beta-ribofuranosylaminobenzene 5'-phosphate synthase|uniref:chorismate--pyruvate lyase family protein n=1 Tax=Candidatus Hecatella orcuttiae TaxID=1935119 RepID=UPI002868037E|nr:chorismate pyruvate-lyase family protein [Candidatus Hecatella orcuttiae]
METFTHLKLLKALSRVERKLGRKLGEGQKILLTTDGSVTRILEILTGKPVVVKTLSRRVAPADAQTARWLQVPKGSRVNYRMVELRNPRPPRVLAVARSWTALSRLAAGIRRDLTCTDLPIGRIISRHRLEVRREILSIRMVSASGVLARSFRVGEGTSLLSKTYNIIHGGNILIRIEEFFPPVF